MKRIMTALFAVLLCVSMPLCAAAAENETENIFRIASLADWAAFAENCRLDAWSARKRVFLECDLDFTGRTLTSVPIFSGHFDGGGHVISGISLTGTGSGAGAFSSGGRRGCDYPPDGQRRDFAFWQQKYLRRHCRAKRGRPVVLQLFRDGRRRRPDRRDRRRQRKDRIDRKLHGQRRDSRYA